MNGSDFDLIANVIIRADIDGRSEIALVAEFCRALPYTAPWFNPDQFINACRLTPERREGVYEDLDLPRSATP